MSDRRKTRRSRASVPHEVKAIREELVAFLDSSDSTGRVPGNAKCGVYVFYDYDGEPIYVGQTRERVRVRIRRHLTNQRTDAVAMNVLDPFEVAEVEIYPFYELEQPSPGENQTSYDARIRQTLAAAEYTVFQNVLRDSALGAVLNEADVADAAVIELPASHRGRIIPPDIYELRKHPDVRIARRASTVANLARVISERDVSPGLRRTLLTQARRIEKLARERLDEVIGEGERIPVERVEEE
ncbi:MAG: GIY-YIG nuclease family protein [Chloroflexia bacterium]|nr:GIY-YIG nuclease family protein [Chloroflexia bacterium]